MTKKYWPLLILLAVGLLLRLPAPDGRSTYQCDELLRDLAVAKDMAAGHLVWLGPPSKFSAFAFGPAYYYLYYPFAWAAGFRVWSLALGSLAFSLAGIVLIFITARRWFRDNRLAYLVAGLLTVSALDVQFAKYASNPNAVPFFALLFFLSLERLIARRGGPGAAAVLGLSYGIAAQLHIIPLIGLTLILICLLAARRLRPSIRETLVFSAIVLTLNAPYIYFQLSRGLAALWDVVAAAPAAVTPLGTWPTRFAETASFWTSLVVRLSQLYGANALYGLLALVGIYANVVMIAFIWLLERRRTGAATAPLAPSVRLSLILWFAPTAVLLLPIGRVDILPLYYFTMFVPLGYLLIGLGLKKLWAEGRRTTAGCLLLSYFAWQIVQIWQYHLEYPSLLTAWIGR